MTKILKFLAALLIAVPVFAQAQRAYSQAELDQMLAPVALYPDALLSQVLMAATYPREVLEAADWSRSNRGLAGDDAVRAVQGEDWDPSVKSLVAFPQLLARMEEKLDWTRDLGDAFLAQEADVMDTVQQLRRRARAAGNLESGEQLQVEQQNSNITLRVASAQHFYVPYYDPLVVYGSWWWPAYRPVYWAPWPGYVRHRVSVAFWWGAPIRLSVNFFYGSFDWQQRQVRVVHVNNYYYRPSVVVNRTVVVTPGRWQHEPQHRRDIAYRDAVVRERFAAARPERAHDRNERPQTQPQVQAQPRPQAQARSQAQPQVRPEARPEPQPRTEQRNQRRGEQQAAMETQRQAQQQARQAQEAQRQAQQLQRAAARQETRPNMPAAQAPQLPRAERHEQRQEKRDERQEKHEERGHKAG